MSRDDEGGTGAADRGPDEAAGASGVDAVEESLERLDEIRSALPPRVNVDPEDAESGLAQLVLTLLEVIREVLEHQAVRRMESGDLSDEELERLGLGLLRLSEKMDEMKETFGLSDEDLRLDLGPLGRLR